MKRHQATENENKKLTFDGLDQDGIDLNISRAECSKLQHYNIKLDHILL